MPSTIHNRYKNAYNHTHKIFWRLTSWFCNLDIPINKYEIFKGNRDQCIDRCVDLPWCKSFDFCNKYDTKFCHLKDIGKDEYQKEYATGKGISDVYECKGNNRKLINTQLNTPIYIVGENS